MAEQIRISKRPFNRVVENTSEWVITEVKAPIM